MSPKVYPDCLASQVTDLAHHICLSCHLLVHLKRLIYPQIFLILPPKYLLGPLTSDRLYLPLRRPRSPGLLVSPHFSRVPLQFILLTKPRGT